MDWDWNYPEWHSGKDIGEWNDVTVKIWKMFDYFVSH